MTIFGACFLPPTRVNNRFPPTRLPGIRSSSNYYLHDHFFPVQLDANRDRVCQEAKLVHRTVVDAQLQCLPVYLEGSAIDGREKKQKANNNKNNQQQRVGG